MKKTEIKVYLKTSIELSSDDFFMVGNKDLYLLIGEEKKIQEFINQNNKYILKSYYEYTHLNSLMPLSDISKFDARIEPGAIIRDKVIIEKDAVILMGAVINCNAKIGSKTMIDMNAVIGSGAKIGSSCHIGAGAVIAGILEPKSKNPVVIENNVFVGANAVVLEGIHIGEGAIIGAGAVVTKDVLKNQTVVGVPAKVINPKYCFKINEGLR